MTLKIFPELVTNGFIPPALSPAYYSVDFSGRNAFKNRLLTSNVFVLFNDSSFRKQSFHSTCHDENKKGQ